MKYILFSLVLLAILTVAICSNECSVKKISDFMNCMSKKIEQQSRKWTVKSVKAFENDLFTCFAQNGCEKPDFARDIFTDLPPVMHTMFRKMANDWEDMPKEVEACVHENIKDELKNKLNQCLTKQKVPVVEELPEGIEKHTTEIFKGNATKKNITELLLVRKANLARSLRLCRESKGEEAEKKAWDCFQNFRKKFVFDDMCTEKMECANENKLGDTCAKRYQEIISAVCKCKEEEKEELAKKFKQMRESNDADEFVVRALFAEKHNLDETIATIKKCYKDKLPPSITQFEQMHHNATQSGDGQKLSLNSTAIAGIEDIVMGMYNEEQCYVGCRFNFNTTID